MRTTVDLPDELIRHAESTALKRGCTLRELVLEGLRRVLPDQAAAERRRIEALELPPGPTIPLRTGPEGVIDLNEMRRGR